MSTACPDCGCPEPVRTKMASIEKDGRIENRVSFHCEHCCNLFLDQNDCEVVEEE